jgi:hypothetical protein
MRDSTGRRLDTIEIPSRPEDASRYLAACDTRSGALIPIAGRCSTYDNGLSNGTDTPGTFAFAHTLG